MDVLFLDFDGVILDSAGETAITAWRGGRHLWPRDWSGAYPPAWLINSFRRLRPLLHTGYESFGLLRLAWLAGDEEGRKLVPNTENQKKAAALLAATGWQRQNLVELFGTTRDHWLQTDFQSWMQANRFYPGMVESLRIRLQQPKPNLFILTTKQNRFVTALLDHAGLEMDTSFIFGLDSGMSKQQRLLNLCTDKELAQYRQHFIEDRLPTLLEIAREKRLENLRLYLAEWGYITEDDSRQTRKLSRINPLSKLGLQRLLTS